MVGRRRRPLAPEFLERRILLSFSQAAVIGNAYQASWADFNNDGWTDLYAEGILYRNDNGNLNHFQTFGCCGAVWGDFNNDRFIDFYEFANHRLYQNEGGTSFTNVSSMLPSLPVVSRQAAAFGDYNGDSYLDLYIGGFETWPTAYHQDVIFMNNAGQSFSMEWAEGGQPRPSRGVAPFDFDEDGDLDIYVSNYRLERNALWQNDGHGNITDVASAHNATGGSGHTIGSAIGDLDNDGHLDIFVANFSHPGQQAAQFLRNTGDTGGYTFEVMDELDGGDWQESYATASLADYDNDSYLDLYFTTAYPGNHPRLYRNNGGTWNFSNVTSAEGLGGQPPTFQAAWADFDNDGDLDLAGAGILYRNNTTGNNWLQVDLRGDGLNVSTTAIGAVVRAGINGKTVARQVDGGSGQGNQNDQTLHFGLGNSSQPVPLEVTWPDGTVRTLHASANQKITVDYNEREEFVNVIDIGEVGIVDTLTHNSQTVVLNRHYHNPVVFAQPLSYSGTSPAVVRVENIQSDRFDLFIAEPSDENGLHAAQETASYIVIEAGNYVLADGTRLEVGTVDTSATVGNHLLNSWELVRFDTTFATNFSSTPVVLSQIQTHHGPNYLQTRHLSTSQSSVTLAMQQEEVSTAVLDTETVGYLAIETGAGQWNGMAYEAKLMPYFLTHNWSKV